MAGGSGARGLLGGGGEREDHAVHALIEDAFRGPQFIHRDARKYRGGESAGRQYDVAEGFQRHRGMLHFHP